MSSLHRGLVSGTITTGEEGKFEARCTSFSGLTNWFGSNPPLRLRHVAAWKGGQRGRRKSMQQHKVVGYQKGKALYSCQHKYTVWRKSVLRILGPKQISPGKTHRHGRTAADATCPGRVYVNLIIKMYSKETYQ